MMTICQKANIRLFKDDLRRLSRERLLAEFGMGSKLVMTQNQFPPGWDEAKVQAVIKYYEEEQTEAEAVAEAEEALEQNKETVMVVPKELVPIVRELIAKHLAS
jgi:hypothetical protein